MTYNTKQLETLDYRKPEQPAAISGMNCHVLKPGTRVNKAEDAETHCPKCGQEWKNHGPHYTCIDNRADQPIRSLEEAKATAREYFKTTEQPLTSNQIILEQVEGSTKVTLELLNQLEPNNTDQRGDVQGCIWTLEGWLKNNLKHLKKGFE